MCSEGAISITARRMLFAIGLLTPWKMSMTTDHPWSFSAAVWGEVGKRTSVAVSFSESAKDRDVLLSGQRRLTELGADGFRFLVPSAGNGERRQALSEDDTGTGDGEGQEAFGHELSSDQRDGSHGEGNRGRIDSFFEGMGENSGLTSFGCHCNELVDRR